MGLTLSANDVAVYQRQGFLCPLTALSTDEVAFHRGRLEDFEAQQGKKLGKIPGWARAKSHLLFTWMDQLSRHPAVLDAVEDMIGPDILLFHLTCWIKEPGDQTFTSWHQDATYFGLEPFEHITAWVALSDSEPVSGCVEVVPGSHTIGQRPHEDEAGEGNLLSRGQTLAEMIDTPTVDLAMRAGEFSLHHTHLIHRSGANRSSDRRIGIGLSYIPTHVRHVGPNRLSAMLVRGQDRYGNFDIEPRPAADYDSAARAFHADAMRRFLDAGRVLAERSGAVSAAG